MVEMSTGLPFVTGASSGRTSHILPLTEYETNELSLFCQ